jgi:hypothetical protein
MMLPLMEMLLKGANGDMVNQMARQFGMNQQQATSAIEALLPAFSEGLKRNMADPAGFMRTMAAMSQGGYDRYFDDPSAAFTPQGTQQGNEILGNLFGSKDLSRAVAAQASAATGLSQAMLKSVLPALAPVILGGLFKQMTGGLGAQQAPSHATAGANPLGELLEQMMGGGRQPSPRGQADNPFGKMLEDMLGGGRPTPQPGGNPGANPWGDILEQMMGGRGRSANPSDPGAGMDNPLGRIFEQMTGGVAREPEPEPVRRRTGSIGKAGAKAVDEAPDMPRGRKEAQDRARPRNPLEDLFGEMLETGRKTQGDYQKGIESIFDQFMTGMKR